MEVEGEKKPRRRRWLRRLGVVVLVLVVLLAGIKVTDMAMTAYERSGAVGGCRRPQDARSYRWSG